MEPESSICFYDQNFISQFPLTQENIIQYFALSPFYDRNCLNEVLRMQSQFTGTDISHRLTSLQGFYYELEHSGENLFIIAKKNNTGQSTVTVRLYYVIHGYIYCAPTTKQISDSRIVDSLWNLNVALDMYSDLRKFDWLEGFQVKYDTKVSEDGANEMKFALEVLHEYEKYTK